MINIEAQSAQSDLPDLSFKNLTKTEIEFLKEIDRNEFVKNEFRVQEGKLELVKASDNFLAWQPGEVETLIKQLDQLYKNGGTIYGAFYQQKIVGMAALSGKFIGRNKDQLQLDLLYVSHGYRKMGIGKILMKMVSKKAKEMGASRLYISATPTQNTINFYLGIGCQLASEVDRELYDLEPTDIHLELKL